MMEFWEWKGWLVLIVVLEFVCDIIGYDIEVGKSFYVWFFV